MEAKFGSRGETQAGVVAGVSLEEHHGHRIGGQYLQTTPDQGRPHALPLTLRKNAQRTEYPNPHQLARGIQPRGREQRVANHAITVFSDQRNTICRHEPILKRFHQRGHVVAIAAEGPEINLPNGRSITRTLYTKIHGRHRS